MAVNEDLMYFLHVSNTKGSVKITISTPDL